LLLIVRVRRPEAIDVPKGCPEPKNRPHELLV
jgi:hypothetical protein